MKHAIFLFSGLMAFLFSEAQNEEWVNRSFPDPTVYGWKGKPVIVDFFSSNCLACFQKFPETEQLRRQFEGKLGLQLVGVEDKIVRKVYAGFERRFNLHLAVRFDSLAKKMKLPYFPCYVWVGPDGVIKWITGTEAFHRQNIERFIQGKDILVETAPEKIPFDVKRPLLLYGNGGHDSDFIKRSLLSAWKPNQTMYLPYSLRATKDSSRFQVLGATVEDLFKYALLGERYWPTTSPHYARLYPRILVSPSIPPAEWNDLKDKRFCYSVVLPEPAAGFTAIRKTLLQDLKDVFGYEALFSNRPMPCWKLIAVDSSVQKLRTKGGSSRRFDDHASINYQNVRIGDLIDFLQRCNPEEPPFVDQTGIDFRIDLSLSAIASDLADVQEALRSVGLSLVRSQHPMDVLVLQQVVEKSHAQAY